jgi:hypothetical protein
MSKIPRAMSTRFRHIPSFLALKKLGPMEGRHFEPLNLDTYKNKSLTAESMEIAKTIMNNIISSNTLVTFKSVKDIFTRLWTTDFTSFVKNAKYPGADVVAMESLWSLINQDEFLFMSVFQDVPFIPKIYGSCGAYYVTEFAPPGQILSPSFHYILQRELSSQDDSWYIF